MGQGPYKQFMGSMYNLNYVFDSELKADSCWFHRNPTESAGIPEFRSIPADSVGISGFRRIPAEYVGE